MLLLQTSDNNWTTPCALKTLRLSGQTGPPPGAPDRGWMHNASANLISFHSISAVRRHSASKDTGRGELEAASESEPESEEWDSPNKQAWSIRAVGGPGRIHQRKSNGKNGSLQLTARSGWGPTASFRGEPPAATSSASWSRVPGRSAGLSSGLGGTDGLAEKSASPAIGVEERLEELQEVRQDEPDNNSTSIRSMSDNLSLSAVSTRAMLVPFTAKRTCEACSPRRLQ